MSQLLWHLSRLFEDVAIDVGELLAVDNNRGVPGPDVLNILAISLVGVVELDELVALVVRSDIEGGKSLLATDQEDTSVDTSVVLSVDTLATKEVLAGSLKTSVETTYIFI
jgi:hypothetical protein